MCELKDPGLLEEPKVGHYDWSIVIKGKEVKGKVKKWGQIRRSSG